MEDTCCIWGVGLHPGETAAMAKRGQRSDNIVTGPGETKEDFLEVPKPHRSQAAACCYPSRLIEVSVCLQETEPPQQPAQPRGAWVPLSSDTECISQKEASEMNVLW